MCGCKVTKKFPLIRLLCRKVSKKKQFRKMREKHPAQGAVETQVGLHRRHRCVSGQDTGGSRGKTQVGLPR